MQATAAKNPSRGLIELIDIVAGALERHGARGDAVEPVEVADALIHAADGVAALGIIHHGRRYIVLAMTAAHRDIPIQ